MIEIKNIQGNVIYSTEINRGAKRKFTLMKDDYVTLPFSLEEPKSFPIGSYAEISGIRYEVVDLQKPTPNASTGGYDYNLRLDAYYWKWKNKIFKFTPEVGGQEASWSLTASLDVHLDVFLRNLKALGYTYGEFGFAYEFSLDATVENKAVAMTYENMNMIDALSALAEAFDCEWWVSENVIHFGRCEHGTPVDFVIDDNVAEMSRSESKNSYATRLYVFGSTRNIPPNYRPVDENVVVNGVVQRRLMLPEGIPYIDAYENMSEEEAIEQVVVLDEIYPKTDGEISHIETYDSTVENEDGTTTTETFYRFKDNGVTFSEEYIIEGQDLKAKFTSGLLYGMEFGIKFNPNGEEEKLEGGAWNPEAQLYEIVANEDYGRKLPDETLRPKVGDTYILTGWDITKIGDLGLIEKAEQELYERGIEISEKMKIDPNTYNCKMMSDYMYGLDSEGNQNSYHKKTFNVGDRVNLINEAYFEEGRQSRIIGYEYNLDFPFDNPVYTVGETVAYSRLGALESKIDALTLKGQTYTSSGGGTGSGQYLRKDQADVTPFPLGVGALVLRGKNINQLIRYYDEDKPEEVTDVDIYSALMTEERIQEGLKDLDDRYLRKDKEDTAHKHITFEEGIDVYTLAKMVNLEVTELARIAKAFVTQIGSEKFVDGFFGEGYQIWKAIATGDWCMTIDRLTVRKVMTVLELIIQKIRSVGGMVVVSAGNGKVKEVEQVGLEYKFTFEDKNTFQVNDLMRCQVWTGDDVKHYWVEVTRVDGENVFARIADFGDAVPVPGDEVVLMGNTQNKLRQGLVLISAAEDGQPRVDVMDGVNSTNFDDCLKARLGALDGITDSRFPADMQPKGYGIYGNNCYLTGVFVLSNGKNVQTQFAILEGMIRANMSSVQQQINAEDNYLSNASMTTNLMGWDFHNDVKVFRTSGGLLHFNGNFYSIKNAIAGIVPNGEMVVLRLKNSYIRQKNANFAMRPTFDLVEQTTTEADGNEVGTGVKLYRPRMFYVSFRYMVKTRGTLRVYFENEETRSDFEPYTKLNYTKVLEAGDSFTITDDTIAGKWNGTGDFYLSFDGEMLLYDLVLADDPLSDMEERWSMQLEITEKKIQANAEHIIQQGEDLEKYRSEFLFTAEQLRTEFTALVQNAEKDITEEYTGLVTQTAQQLESDYNAKIGDYYGTITEEYNSKITQTAKDITTELNAKIDATDKAVGDLEVGLKADYNAKIAASAQELQSDYNSKITNLKNGDIADMKSSITQNANQIATKVSQTNFDALSQRVSTAESSITQNANQIATKVEQASFNALNQTVSSHSSSITQLSNRISAVANSIETDASGNITNISKSGLVLDTEFASLFSEQMDENEVVVRSEIRSFVIKNADGTLESGVKITADVVDINNGVVAIDSNSATIGGFDVGVKRLTNINGDASIAIGNKDYSNYITINDGDEFIYIDVSGSGKTALDITASNGAKAVYAVGECILASTDMSNMVKTSGLALSTQYGSSFGRTGADFSGVGSWVDFLVLTSNATLPTPSTCKGKVLFVKLNGFTLSGKIIQRHQITNSQNAVSSVAHGNLSAFYISDGTYWQEFLSVD